MGPSDGESSGKEKFGNDMEKECYLRPPPNKHGTPSFFVWFGKNHTGSHPVFLSIINAKKHPKARCTQIPDLSWASARYKSSP